MDLPSAAISLAILTTMFYAGLLFDLDALKQALHKRSIMQLAKLSAVNFLLVPLLAWLMITCLAVNSALSLAILTVAIFPCAPVVPSIVARVDQDSSWALVVLATFSILSLPATLIAYWLFSDSGGEGLASTTLLNLGGYMLVVYPPIALGIGLRRAFYSLSMRCLNGARLAMNIALLLVVVVFSLVHFEDLAAVELSDLLYLLLFVLLSLCCSLWLFSDKEANFSTTLLSTGMRNIALAISFSVLVLGRSDVSVYHFIYILLAALGCFTTFKVRGYLHERA